MYLVDGHECPACSGSELRTVSKHLDFPAAAIIGCARCGHHHAHPEPDEAFLERYYRDVYAPKRAVHFGEAYDAIMIARAEAQRAFILRHRGESPPVEQWSVCDVGCGIGALVAAFAGRSARVVGYDTDTLAVERGLRLFEADLRNGLLRGTPEPSFDLLAMSHVVEHLPDVESSLRELLGWLHPGGLLFVEVPTCFDEMFRLGIDTEAHLNFFTPGSLERMLRKLGLEVPACLSCGPPVRHAVRDHRRTAAPRIVRRGRALLDRLGRRRGRAERGLYDGFYEAYDEPGRGTRMWIRALARRPGPAQDTE